MYRIGLDISGGDYAPSEIIKGAILARKEFQGTHITLIGVKEEIEKEIAKHKSKESFTIIDAPEKIEMAEQPAASVRRKRNSSIVRGVTLLKEKKIDAFVSCGNTGAVVCASTLILRLIEGVERPGIALMIPTKKGISLIIDVGANIGPKPLHLLQYAAMAYVYYKLVLGKEDPTVGLLNIGEEASKGSEFVKRVHKLFSCASINFVGNLEAKDIFSGKCDCIVCDGFVGNIALKVSESCADVLGRFLIDEILEDPLGKIGLFLMQRSLRKFKKKIHYAEYGGAPLLGVDGIVIIGHGRSSSLAVKNAIKVAIEELSRGLNLEIKRRINEICQNSGVRQVFTV
ncbi:MAG: phosphate acyltransferase PlsX [Candidatus Omnitrophota bacterium]|nr:MAG: phosphate acyltransferase PlsX [Candidatus Omnitrophota bacterium]